MSTVESRAAAPDNGADASAENHQIAERLRQAATLLAAQQANPFRVTAYRKAADSIERLPGGVRELFRREGRAGLDALPSIGPGIAGALAEILATGRWSQLDRLRGEVDPRRLFRMIPGIGDELSERIHDELAVDTLEALEAAAHDGRLRRVQGVGPRRAEAIRAVLAQMLGRPRVPRHVGALAVRALPPVDVLLDVDREYCAKAQADALPRIAPRRFNPQREAWLPILHTQRDRWQFTALYSNTARAHELGHAHDWVVLYSHADDHVEHQHTVVTEKRGTLAGRRVVRGREAECAAWYARAAT